MVAANNFKVNPYTVKKDLSVRVHECLYCGFSCDRDHNASRNILLAGMEQPVAPIESKPLHRISVMQVLAMKWQAVPFRARQFTYRHRRSSLCSLQMLDSDFRLQFRTHQYQ
ncbi:MAG: zinc ribbon domain-containing protein [Methanothrix sp.]